MLPRNVYRHWAESRAKLTSLYIQKIWETLQELKVNNIVFKRKATLNVKSDRYVVVRSDIGSKSLVRDTLCKSNEINTIEAQSWMEVRYPRKSDYKEGFCIWVRTAVLFLNIWNLWTHVYKICSLESKDGSFQHLLKM